MALCTLNNIAVLGAELVLPRVGVFHADIDVDTETPLSGAVTLAFGDGALVFNGTILRGDVFRGKFRARIVGGAGGLGKSIAPKYYRGAPLRLPLQDILDACGERLSSSSDPAVLGRLLLKWSRRQGAASDALASLLREVGAAFRMLPDGSVWVGTDTYPEVTFDFDLLGDDTASGRLELASDLPRLLPGTTFLNKKISAVVHTVTSDRVRTTAWIERDGVETDRLKNPLRAFVRSAVGEIDFLKRYAGRVVLQEADGTLHVQPDSEAIPGLTGVPIRYGAPGVRAKVPAGARCVFEYERADPGSPIVTAFEPGALIELSFDDGTHAVAREGDRVDAGTLSFAVDPSGTSLVITYRPPGAAPEILTLTIPGVSLVGTTSSFALSGAIAEGAARVRA